MKKLFSMYALFTFILLSCSNDKNTAQITTKEHLDASTATINNMQTAYKGEVTAVAKYLAFAQKAETEGYHNIAIMYEAVSAAENIHAINHKAVIEDAAATVATITSVLTIKSTKENLLDDINGEAKEAKTMYPDFLKTAKIADNQIALLSLTYAMKTELKHKYFFEQALGDINSNTLLSLPSTYYVCPTCGNTFSKAPRHCEFSLTDRNKFIVFN